MFAHRITFGPSLFSPHKKPRIVHYGIVTKKIINHLPAVPTADEAAINILSIDSLVLVMMAVYEMSTTAPLCAAVSRAFKQATQQAEKNCKDIDVAPHRRYMKVTELPSLLPSVAEDDAVIASWGKNLESYKPEEGLLSCSKNDLERILDLKGADRALKATGGSAILLSTPTCQLSCHVWETPCQGLGASSSQVCTLSPLRRMDPWASTARMASQVRWTWTAPTSCVPR